MIELSTSMALGRVQDAVKQAFRSVREEMIPLYMTTDIDHRDAWERVRKTTEPFENEVLITLMHDTFNPTRHDVFCVPGDMRGGGLF